MDTRVNHLIIGKDVSPTANLTLGTATANSNLVEGEIVLLDKHMKLLSASPTKDDSDTIYIAVGTSDTYYNPGQTTYTKRGMKISPAITRPVSFEQAAPVAKVEKKQHIAIPVVNETTLLLEAAVSVNYTDDHVVQQTPGMFVQSWRYDPSALASGATAHVRGLVTKINADVNSRVIALTSTGGTGMHLYSKTLTSADLGTEDEYFMVNFDAFFYRADQSTGTESGHTAFTTTSEINYGKGTYYEMKDIERANKPYEGVGSKQAWPAATYHDSWMVGADASVTFNQFWLSYNKLVPDTNLSMVTQTNEVVCVAVPYKANGNQWTKIVNDLTSWCNSWGLY